MSAEVQPIGTLMLRDKTKDTIVWVANAQQLKDEALEKAAVIGRVTNAEEQQAAVDAQKAIALMLKHVEQSRKKVKEPMLVLMKLIDDEAMAPRGKFVKDLCDEDMRIGRMVSDFQALEMAKVRAAQAAENERLLQIERDRQKELAEVKTHDDADKVNMDFDNKVQQQSLPPASIPRVEGQIVKEGWQFEVVDVWALAKAHPTCVNPPEPKRREITAMLEAGIKVVGVKAWKETKASVSTREKKAIDV